MQNFHVRQRHTCPILITILHEGCIPKLDKIRYSFITTLNNERR